MDKISEVASETQGLQDLNSGKRVLIENSASTNSRKLEIFDAGMMVPDSAVGNNETYVTNNSVKEELIGNLNFETKQQFVYPVRRISFQQTSSDCVED